MRKTWRKIKGTVRDWVNSKSSELETDVGASYLREVTLDMPISEEGAPVDMEELRRRIMEFPYVIPYSEPRITRTAEGTLQITAELFDSRQAGKLREKLGERRKETEIRD